MTLKTNYNRILCHHCYTDETNLHIRGPATLDPDKPHVKTYIPLREVLHSNPKWVSPIPPGFRSEGKKAGRSRGLADGCVVFEVIVPMATAAFCPIISEPISDSELQRIQRKVLNDD